MSSSHDITRLLQQWADGSCGALEELTPLIYHELRQLADSYLRRESGAQTMQPTALVHEAYIRLVDQHSPDWESRSHFFGIAARIMRQILVDHARSRQSPKRGGALKRVSLGDCLSSSTQYSADLILLNDGLNELEDKGVQTLDCRRAQFSAEEPLSRLRMICQSWKVMFQAEYSSGQPLRMLVDLRASIEYALGRGTPAASGKANAAAAAQSATKAAPAKPPAPMKLATSAAKPPLKPAAPAASTKTKFAPAQNGAPEFEVSGEASWDGDDKK